MGYQTVPTFVAGPPASATQLNILRDNNNHFYGVANGINTAWIANRYVSQWGTTKTTFNYRIVHRVQYFHWNLNWTLGGGGDTIDYDITYDGTNVLSGTATGNSSAASSIDLDVTPGGLTVGTAYNVVVTLSNISVTGSNFIEITELYESETA